MNGALSFNTNNLQTYDPTTKVGILTNVIDHVNAPDQAIALFTKADANGSSISSINHTSKKIVIRGSIHGSSQADLDDRIDTFKGYFNGKDKNLDITYGSGTRRYIATKNAIAVERQQKALFANFVVEFICALPFGVDTAETVITNETGYTSATITATPTIAGSAPLQYPIITITLNAITGEGDSIQVSNDNNGQSMVLFGLGLEAGDVIVIDAFERTVKVDDISVDYVGTFLELEPGAQSLTITDGFETRNVDINIAYYKRWL